MASFRKGFRRALAALWVAAIAAALWATAIQAGPGDDEPIGPGPYLNAHAPASMGYLATQMTVWGHAHNISDGYATISYRTGPTSPVTGHTYNVDYTWVNGGDTIDCEYDVDISGFDPPLQASDTLYSDVEILSYDDWTSYGDTGVTAVQ